MAGLSAETESILHASCVQIEGRGLLILGPSGSGKSALALQMMALGAMLVADDRTIVTPAMGGLLAACPPALSGLIEARGLGLLRAGATGPVELALAVDLGQRETQRLPPKRQILLAGLSLDLVLGQDGCHFPAALLQFLRKGRQA
ncbi:MAG: HPr kinase/phosphatase C-terminal domain-containing protein [Paracoccaceae bacterium]|nr:HPr kinase/phosphatase C-terminal domain-containing protein [Paracoccaceae bacterium]